MIEMTFPRSCFAPSPLSEDNAVAGAGPASARADLAFPAAFEFLWFDAVWMARSAIHH